MSLTYVPVIPADRDIEFSGDITISGATTLSGAVTVDGRIDFNGDIDITDEEVRSTQAAASDIVLASIVTGGGAFDWLRVRADGRLDWGPGSATRDTNLYRDAADTLRTDDAFEVGDTLDVTGHTTMTTGQTSGTFTIFTGSAAGLDLGTAGGGIAITEGSNARMGTATLSSGTVTVSNTSITANTRIFLTVQALGTVSDPQAVHADAVVAGTSFDITSADATDTSTVAWLLIEPS